MTVPRKSGWEQWKDPAERAMHLRVTLTDDDARRMHAAQLAMLEDAARLIALAFDSDTPAHLAALQAELLARAGSPRRVADLSASELRHLLARMGAAR